jgi:hypothetical protein
MLPEYVKQLIISYWDVVAAIIVGVLVLVNKKGIPDRMFTSFKRGGLSEDASGILTAMIIICFWFTILGVVFTKHGG